eukprot:m.197903 g.197903  ORF g.197903 m.197903 type:complete len:1056 (+) comp14912_c0_seq1:122-3289(+)
MAGLQHTLLPMDEPDELEASPVASRQLLPGAGIPVSLDSSDDEDELVVPITQGYLDDADALPTPQRNPFHTLNDIARQEHTYADETDNLALYQEDISRRPRVARILSRLVQFNRSEDEESLTVEHSMLALLRKTPVKMGTLTGVYLPTIQNILGVILFLRFAWIVGIAGVGQALLIISICCITTMLTAISMSAIATNGVVPAGGSYFMISRSLGPEFGGAVGILFYLGTTFASSMYILGAIELLLTYIAPQMSLFGDATPGSPAMLNNMRVYGTILLSMMALIVFVGVKYVNGFANLCLVMVLLSILSIFVGFFTSPTRRQPDICLIDGGLMDSDYNGTCTAADIANYAWQNVSTVFVNRTGFPGLGSGTLKHNVGSNYLQEGQGLDLNMDPEPEQVVADVTTSFTTLLAIFFPACTGIMAGSNRSGDLQDASRSIPVGTISAILTTATIYILSALFLGAVVEGVLLRDKFGDSIDGGLIIAELAWPHPFVILLGALMSCTGAGLQSLMGAPRLLQAIAQDNLLPFLSYFGKASASGEPTRALILTVLISECGIVIASLDAVAPILTMFFLLCYGFVNLACSLQSLLKAPSWRPRFRYYHWSLSALGVLLCLTLMFISSWVYAFVACLLAFLVYYYIEFKGAAKEWGDGLRGLSMQAARYSLLRLEESNMTHTKNWRPQILTFVKLNPQTLDVAEPHLLGLAASLKNGKGLNMVASVIEGQFIDRAADRLTGQFAIKSAMKANDIQGFAEVIVSPRVAQGLSYLIQGSGLGQLKQNTVLLGWPEGWRQRLETAQRECEGKSEEEIRSSLRQVSVFMRVVLECTTNQHALIIPKNIHLFPAPADREEGTIDVWWVVHDGGMLILLAFLLQQDVIWRKCQIRVFTVAENDDNTVQMEQDLKSFLYHLRIDAEVKVIEMLDSDILAYTYEKAEQMQERSRIMQELRLTPKQKKMVPEQVVLQSKGRIPQASRTRSPTSSEEDDALRRMNTSVKLNRIIKEHSVDAKLILVNLPGAPDQALTGPAAAMKYLDYLEVLTEGLNRVVMVRGGGREVITIFS